MQLRIIKRRGTYWVEKYVKFLWFGWWANAFTFYEGRDDFETLSEAELWFNKAEEKYNRETNIIKTTTHQ